MFKVVLILFSLISLSFAEVKYPTQQEFIDKIRNQEFDYLIVGYGTIHHGVLKGSGDSLFLEGHYPVDNILVRELIDKSGVKLVVSEDDSVNYYWMQELFFIVLVLIMISLFCVMIYKQNQILKLLRQNK